MLLRSFRMSHEKIFLEDINITGTQVWKIYAQAFFIELMNPLYYVPDYVSDPEIQR